MEKLEAMKEKAAWCLGCQNKPCSQACPMHTNIPEFIQKIKENQLKEAYQILVENNLFSHVCSLVCPQENQCQGACVRGIKETATEIGELEAFVNEWAIEKKIYPEIKQEQKNTNKRVAVIGAGPAGLSCSYELAKRGIKVVVLEKELELGGLLSYGIPDFRLDKRIVDRAIQILRNLGVEFKLGQAWGNAFTLKDLKKEFDFVFIGVGAEIPNTYSLSEQQLDMVHNADAFLRAYHKKRIFTDLGRVVVIGGGNVAIDSARAAVRMGAKKVSILYRRNRRYMAARPKELRDALDEGIKWIELTRVEKANVENGNLISVHCHKTQIVEGKVQDVPGEEFDYSADTIIFAIGLKPNQELIQKEGLEMTDDGMIRVDENHQTSIENVYSGGDATENKSVVCKALASGKKAAESILAKI